MKLFRQKIMDRMGTDAERYAVTLPTASTQSSACQANVYHLVESDEPGIQYAISGDHWIAYQTERGVCWICGAALPTHARFCIACGVEIAPATGETEQIYVPLALGKTERL